MEILTVNEAKTNFGEMLVQRASVAEEIKMELLRAKIRQAEFDVANGNLTDGETFMQDIILGKFD